ncbi:Lysosomal acid phosphatase [Trichinella papuae]|uniref:acid phosphatase n=1 Tax=Trichinella papuae TaxID=268474 RepID=A0A0V1MIV5_9BILA|nr:Lysosomal acid phosphatase [Trichinella papuae]
MHVWTHIYLRPRITDCIMIFRCHQIYGTFLIIASTLHLEVTSCNRMTCGRETKKEKKRETRNEKRKHITNSTHNFTATVNVPHSALTRMIRIKKMPGQMGSNSCHQQYELGNFLRRKYSKLLSKSYKSYEIYVRSTNTSRTLASAACNLAGLYPSIQPEIIPIHTVAEEEDFLLKTGLPCPGYDSAYKKDSRKVFSKIDKANKDFFKFVAKMSGIRDASTKSIGRLVGALEREIKNNFIMPEWVFTVWWDSTVGKYRTVYDMLYEFNSVRQLTKFNSKKKARFLVGTLMRNMKSKVNNYRKESKKMNMYSAHDGTVMSLMYALGIANDINPPVASCIMFDLYKNFHTDRFYVEIQFRNDTKEPPVPLILPKCMLRLCPLEKVYKILQKVSFDHTVEGKAVRSFIKCAFRVPTDSS